MIQSKFQFSNPQTDECVFITNKECVSNIKNDLTLRLKCNSQRVKNDDESNKVIVSLCLEIGDIHDNNSPFYLKLIESAKFIWEDNAFNDDMIKDLLEINASALLLSYIRPLVAIITAQSANGVFHIPYIDMRKNLNKNKQNDF